MKPKKSNSDLSRGNPLLFGILLASAAALLLFGAAAAVFFAEDKDLFSSEEQLGMVRIQGMIMDPEAVSNWIRTLREDESVLGVLIRIDSPGGAVAPSQEIHSAVKRLADKKTVVVSMGSVAASGGYYVAAPADHIVANPATITGSIGVRMEVANLEELFDKLGIRQSSLTSGKFKDAGSPFRPMSDEEREYLQSVVDDMHDQFVTHVAAGRNMTMAEAREFADGRIFTGREAHIKGLVDELGDMEAAFAALRRMTDAPEGAEVLEGPPEEEFNMLRLLLSSVRSDAHEMFPQSLPFLFR